jgi:hypothetical protein
MRYAALMARARGVGEGACRVVTSVCGFEKLYRDSIILEIQQGDGLACQQPVEALVDVIPLVRPKLPQLGGICVHRDRDLVDC